MYNNYTDFISPWYLIIAVIGALCRRRKTGKGMYMEQGQYESAISFIGPAMLDYAVNGRAAERMGNRDPSMAPHGAYPCQGNDRWCNIAVQTEEEWQALCRAMGDPEWARSPRFSTLVGKKANEEELDRLIGEWTKDYLAEKVMHLMQGAGVPAGVVST